MASYTNGDADESKYNVSGKNNKQQKWKCTKYIDVGSFSKMMKNFFWDIETFPKKMTLSLLVFGCPKLVKVDCDIWINH